MISTDLQCEVSLRTNTCTAKLKRIIEITRRNNAAKVSHKLYSQHCETHLDPRALDNSLWSIEFPRKATDSTERKRFHAVQNSSLSSDRRPSFHFSFSVEDKVNKLVSFAWQSNIKWQCNRAVVIWNLLKPQKYLSLKIYMRWTANRVRAKEE